MIDDHDNTGTKTLARGTVNLWSSLTRAFYKEVYGFKFFNKGSMYKGGEVKLSKNTVSEKELIKVFDAIGKSCPQPGDKEATCK